MVYYGHSWILVVIMLGFFVVRMVAMRRRGTGPRSGGPGGPGGPSGRRYGYGPPSMPSNRPLPDGSLDAPPAESPSVAGPTRTGIPAGWLVDPSGKHQQRYWSGQAWTEHVADDGVPGTDPPPGAVSKPDASAPESS